MTPALVGIACFLLFVAVIVLVCVILAMIGAARMRTPDQEKREAVEQLVNLDGRR